MLKNLRRKLGLLVAMWIYEESNSVNDMRHLDISASWFHSHSYGAIRYDHIIAG